MTCTEAWIQVPAQSPLWARRVVLAMEFVTDRMIKTLARTVQGETERGL
jgi:hypothetical protein